MKTIDHGAKERLASDCEVAIGSRHERDVDGGMGNTHYDEELADQQPGPSDNPGPTDDLITTINSWYFQSRGYNFVCIFITSSFRVANRYQLLLCQMVGRIKVDPFV